MGRISIVAAVLGGIAYPGLLLAWVSSMYFTPTVHDAVPFFVWLASLALLGVLSRSKAKSWRWTFMGVGVLSLSVLLYVSSEEYPDPVGLLGGASFGFLGSLVFGVASRTFPWVPVLPIDSDVKT